MLAYAGTYRFNLFSNFTLYLNDPANGDEIEQADRRTFYGAKFGYRVVHRTGPVAFDTTIWADGRNDDIHEELWHTARRRQLAQLRGNDVHESTVGAYFNEEISPSRYRASTSARARTCCRSRSTMAWRRPTRRRPPAVSTAPTSSPPRPALS